MSEIIEGLHKKAQLLKEKKKWTELINLLSDETLSKNNDAGLFSYRAKAHHELKQNDLQLVYSEKAVAANPLLPWAYFERGNAFFNKGLYDLAIKDYNQAIDLDRNYIEPYNNRGLAKRKLHDFAGAIGDFNWAAAYGKDRARAYNNLGITLAQIKDYHAAITSFNHSIELAPDYFEAYNNRGLALISIGEFDKAVQDFNIAINLNSQSPEVYNNRAFVWNKKREYAKAIIDSNTAIDLNPDYANAYYHRGKAFFKLKKFLEAQSDYNRYLEINVYKDSYYAKLVQDSLEEIERLLNNDLLIGIYSIVQKVKRILYFDGEGITHYTRLGVAKFLIADKSPFRISEGAFLNDTSEGLELFNFLGVHFSKKGTNSETLFESFARKPFIGSFVVSDKHNDLTLWRMYGKEEKEEAKGCSITLDRKRLVQAVQHKLVPKDNEGSQLQSEDINFYRIAYYTHEDKARFVIPGLAKAQIKKLNDRMMELKEKVQNYETDGSNQQGLEELLNSIAYLFKSAEYQHEQELRLVVKGTGFEKMVEPKPNVYIELVEIKSLIKQITLGPKVEQADEWAAAFYYSYDNSDHKPEICISHLPFK